MVFGVLSVAPVFYLNRLDRTPVDASLYSVPWVPLLPLIGIFFNVYLIFSNTLLSWLRLVVWTILGCSIYFFYGRQHSKLGNQYSLISNAE